jgi:hypothetical protein
MGSRPLASTAKRARSRLHPAPIRQLPRGDPAGRDDLILGGTRGAREAIRPHGRRLHQQPDQRS